MTKPRATQTLGASVLTRDDQAQRFTSLPVRGLRGDWKFRRLKNKGKPGRNALMSLRWLPAKQPAVTAGIVVSKKVGKAVTRNRIRRRIREALRRMDFPAVEAMIVVTPEAAKARYGDLLKAIHAAARKAGLK